MNKQAINKHLNKFTRPSNLSPQEWLNFKQWAKYAHESNRKQLTWPYEIRIKSTVQLRMLQDENGCFVIPSRLIKADKNEELMRFLQCALHTAKTFLYGNMPEEAEHILKECRIIDAQSPRVRILAEQIQNLKADQSMMLQANSQNYLPVRSRRKPAAQLYRLRENRRAVA